MAAELTYTQYEDRVPDGIRTHTASLMQEWTDDGRDDERINRLVKSLVLNAYASGREEVLTVADNLADRLRSANAVIERMAAAQFNPAILDRIREALEEHRDVCGNVR